MFFVKIFFYLALPTLALVGANYIYRKCTGNFNINQIVSTAPKDIAFSLPEVSTDKKREIKQILSQPFFYLAKGSQCYVFESQDKKYVLKFLKQKHLRIRPYMPFLKEKNQRRKERVKKIYMSFALSISELPELTGVIACHLSKTPFIETNVTLIDKLSLVNPIYIDDYEFILQEKAAPLAEIFRPIKNDPLQIVKKIDLIEKAYLTRLNQGIIDADIDLVKNVAFSDDGQRVMLIDFGSFYKDEEVTLEKIKEDVLVKFNNFHSWAFCNMPELLPFIDEKIKKYN